MATSRRDVLVVGLSILALVASLLFLSRGAPEQFPSPEQILPATEVTELSELRELYGNGGDFLLVLADRSDGRASADHVDAIEAELAKLGGVTRTWSSRSRPRLVMGEGDDHVLTLVPRSKAPSSAVGTRVDQLFEPGAHATLFLVGLEPSLSELGAARRFHDDLRARLDPLREPGEVFRVAGSPAIRAAYREAAKNDAARLLFLLVAAVVLVPFVFFRSLLAALFPLVLAALSAATTLLLYRLVVGTLHPWILVLIPLVWAIATMDAMHLYEGARRNTDGPLEDAVASTRRELLLPCLVTAGTTALSLVTLAIPGGAPMLRAFGIWGAVGAMVAFGFTFATGPAFLRLFRRARAPLPAWPSRLARRTASFARRHARLVLVLWLIVFAASAALVLRIRLAPKYPHVFATGNVVGDDLVAIQSTLGAEPMPLDIYLEAEDAEHRTPERLIAATLGLQIYLETLNETRAVLSASTLVDEWMRNDPRAMQAMRPGFFDESLRAQGASMLEDPRIRPWLRVDRGAARVQLLLAPTDFARKQEILKWIRLYVKNVWTGYRLRFGGPNYVYHVSELEGFRTIAQGAAIDVALLIVTFAIVLRRWRLVLTALLGNVVPVTVVLGVMGALGIPWSLGLLGVPVIVLGLAVDDTVHLLWPLRTVAREPAARFASSVRHCGAAVIATCVMLAACLASLSRSGFQLNRELGVLLPVGLLFALFAELTLVPALLRTFGATASSRR